MFSAGPDFTVPRSSVNLVADLLLVHVLKKKSNFTEGRGTERGRVLETSIQCVSWITSAVMRGEAGRGGARGKRGEAGAASPVIRVNGSGGTPSKLSLLCLARRSSLFPAVTLYYGAIRGRLCPWR